MYPQTPEPQNLWVFFDCLSSFFMHLSPHPASISLPLSLSHSSSPDLSSLWPSGSS